MSAQTFSTGDAARIAGIEPRKLANLLDRQIIPAPKLGQGIPRQFRPDEIVRIALVDRLTRLGLKPTSAAAIADQFHGAHGLLVVDPDGGASLYEHEQIDVPVAITIVDLDGLRREIERRIAA
ncbi:MAG TPA: MerR family transcriptional regulator [Xanthobacteraceae bacterium]|jgi:DNA-binding transcriptional MerR regulator